MPVFTSIGVAIGASAAAAFAVGVGAYALGGGFDGDKSGGDSRVQAATGTGALTHAEAKNIARKKAYRAGVINTTPTGLDTPPNTSTAKLK